MKTWKRLLSNSITTAKQLNNFLKDTEIEEIERVTKEYPMRINPYYFSLIKEKGDPIYLQSVPDIKEIQDTRGTEDPLAEERLSVAPGIVHKYPDRVLFLVSYQCAMYCRFCNRKRKVGKEKPINQKLIKEGISYIRGNKQIKEVLISGGDPLLLEDKVLFQILSELRQISHLEIIRIGTRVPCTLPYRITKRLANMLRQFHPLYIITHFNHPREVTPQSAMACSILADAGIPLFCQTVLLKGVNDNADTIKSLMRALLKIRVKPYYLFYPDYVKGTAHFWVSVEKALEIMKSMYGWVSGLCIPFFAIDLNKGGGKVPLFPEYVEKKENNRWLIRNYKGEVFEFFDLASFYD